MNDDLDNAVTRLAYYEKLEAEGRLVILSIEDVHPCKRCDTGWGSISSGRCITCADTCQRLRKYNEHIRELEEE